MTGKKGGLTDGQRSCSSVQMPIKAAERFHGPYIGAIDHDLEIISGVVATWPEINERTLTA